MRLEYFQMVDRISLLDPAGKIARAECRVPDASPVFEGHFPGHPLVPGVLLIETMAQIGGWLVLAAEATLLHDGSGFAVVEGRLRSDGKLVAGAEITYRVVPFPNEILRGEMLKTARRIAVPEEFFDAA